MRLVIYSITSEPCILLMKLIVVSNRLPLTVSREGDGFTYHKTAGGLVTGIESLSNYLEFIWIGSIGGIDLTDGEKKRVTEECWEKFHCIPVLLSTDLNDKYYDGFCNAILWPALHSFPDDVCFTFNEYKAYKEANMMFAEKILEQSSDGDIVWIHDYHLMLVPGILREKQPGLKITFYLHTVFPDPSNLEQILYRKEILDSLCQCDSAAFHLPEYVQNFREALREFPEKPKLHALPIGIDPKMFRDMLAKPETKARMEELRTRFSGKKIILGVDRTDYIKGIPHKMKGFKRFLERNPGIESDVVLLQIGIPSRLTVREYSAYVAKISELVTQINGAVGNITNTPIHCLFKSVNFSELVALYAISDAIMVTSIMDGFNLVALEYSSVQDENNGVVILSRFAGAQATLQGCISHNPNNTEEIAEALEKALKLTPEDRKERHEKNKRNIDLFTSVKWAEDNLDAVCENWRESLKSKPR